ncbi:hypothetical protein KIH87_12650 [Paraneptunicella aestuarii]|uniref:hypothetical protein n=1 Tax=Paraneptunicella aestuarii TaxID=2831148 RepID=UPI001E4FFEDF|nr:hypothetical protein [Paraneptunicella aestuarii]UAA37558.1 hypothetical protein KIH87_12650 [Paraneptunicella aestuarii]
MKHLILLSSVLFAGYVQAHSSEMLTKLQVIDGASCPKSQTVYLGKMTLSAGTFKYLHSEGSNVCPTRSGGGTNRQLEPQLDCGQFDDWRLAYDMGNKMCNALYEKMKGFENSLPPGTSIWTRFEGPAEFKGDKHHQEFEAGMGVTFACYLCEPAVQ